MAEKINGWTISQRGGQFQAVNAKGVVGISSESKLVVEAFAKSIHGDSYGK